MTSSPWLALDGDPDHVRLAGLLRRAHTIALDTGVAPQIVRRIVSESWRRSVEAGVDPERPAPRMLDARRTAERLAVHPVAAILPRVSVLLREAMIESGYFVAFSDAEGVLLWSDGSSRALRSAVAPRFLPGFFCSEDRVGTNAIGTALVLDRPVQIFSAEHFNRLLHGWTCAAAPVHDPDTSEILGAIDLSGEFRTAHVHALALVSAVATAAEGWLAAERRRADALLVGHYRERCGARPRPFSAVIAASGRVVHAEPPDWLRQPVAVVSGASTWTQSDGATIEAEPLGDGFLVWRAGRPRPRAAPLSITIAGRDRAVVGTSRDRVELNLRHSEIVALLAAHPAGMTVRELARALYGSEAPLATVRAEITRLRRLIGDHVVLSRPYRFHERVRTDLHGGAGPLLPRSTAPGIVQVRRSLEAAFQAA
jgi:hypothetical protein